MTFEELRERTLQFISDRKRSYQLTFSLKQPAAQLVLMDLARFCRAHETCFHEDPRMHAVLEGRREVWLRIQQQLNLTPEALAALYAPKQLETRK